MKKLILFLAVTTILFSCSSDSNSNSNNPSNGNVNYYFKIKINGVEHKVQGNTSGFAVGNDNTSDQNPNTCEAYIDQGASLLFKIADITRPNYVSGQNLYINLSIPNCQVGLNEATLAIQNSPVWNDFVLSPTNNPIICGYFGPGACPFVENSGLYCGNTSASCQYPLWQSYVGKITVNITDMGTPSEDSPTNSPSNYYFNYGNTVKGSFNGPIYFGNSSMNSVGNEVYQLWNMNIPMQFSMEFEAYRAN